MQTIMYRIIKRVQVNSHNQVRVLTTKREFVAARFINDEESLTGPHRPKLYKRLSSAYKAAEHYHGEVQDDKKEVF